MPFQHNSSSAAVVSAPLGKCVNADTNDSLLSSSQRTMADTSDATAVRVIGWFITNNFLPGSKWRRQDNKKLFKTAHQWILRTPVGVGLSLYCCCLSISCKPSRPQALLPRTAGKGLSDASASPSRAANVAALFKEKDHLLTACGLKPMQTEQAKPVSQLRQKSNLSQQKDYHRSLAF